MGGRKSSGLEIRRLARWLPSCAVGLPQGARSSSPVAPLLQWNAHVKPVDIRASSELLLESASFTIDQVAKDVAKKIMAMSKHSPGG